MIDDLSDISSFYNNNSKEEHLCLDRHQLEQDFTWRYLEQYLPSRGVILEIGTATEKYTLELARRGYRLTSVDLSRGMIDECRQNLTQEGMDAQVSLVQADVRDLSQIEEKEFDAVLLIGLLYHLVKKPIGSQY